MYVAGWLKRGPTGIIGTNISDGQITAMSILEDFAQGKLRAGAVEGGDGLRALLASRGVTVVSNEGWQRIDTHERVMGEAAGRPRRKLATIEEMLAAADSLTPAAQAGDNRRDARRRPRRKLATIEEMLAVADVKEV
ncbi:hypothetical protein T484DRAFT_1789292 [Baffinella frigidus]|nr:hypothetical protein T484DRAFT_1789292 [Cryptophyta sp. CCMP2293]